MTSFHGQKMIGPNRHNNVTQAERLYYERGEIHALSVYFDFIIIYSHSVMEMMEIRIGSNCGWILKTMYSFIIELGL